MYPTGFVLLWFPTQQCMLTL